MKTASSGYDGKGQILVETAAEATGAWASLGRKASVAEALVDFAAELSVVVARGVDGQAVCYPVALNRHDRHILDATVMPAGVGPIVTQEAHALALAIAQALGTVGVLTVEFFLTADGSLLVNEIAPRPHNSGHLTIEATIASQFEQQVRALCGLPLAPSDQVMPAAMVNLLGDLWSCRRRAAMGGRAGTRSGRLAASLRKAIGGIRAGRWGISPCSTAIQKWRFIARSQARAGPDHRARGLNSFPGHSILPRDEFDAFRSTWMALAHDPLAASLAA